MSLVIYGSAILDTVYEVASLRVDHNHDHPYIWSRAGGIANTCRAAYGKCETIPVGSVGDDIAGKAFLDDLSQVACVDHISVVNDITSHATIIVDTTDATRTSFVRRGAGYNRRWTPLVLDQTNNWLHFMYLDSLELSEEELQAFREYADATNSIISADISGSTSTGLHKQLQYIDYLFADMCYWQTYDESHVRQGVILHNNCLILHKSKGKHSEIHITPESGLNVLGAGDYFAANCIHQLIQSNSLDLQVAHEATLQLLRTQSYGNKHLTADSRKR